MDKKVLLTFLLLNSSFLAFSQFDCKVLIENLQGQYNGDCKKGLANGDGAAKGVDSYVGGFKKGYPNGFGIYTYKNGANYIGNFRKGLKDGYGLFNKVVNDSIVKIYGLWLADSLIIPNDPKALYRVIDRTGVKLIDPELSNDDNIKSQIWINFQVDGKTDKSVVLTKAEISNGRLLDTKDRSLNTLVAFDDIENVPVTFRLEYQIRKTTHFEMIDCIVELMLFSKGNWEIDINH